MDSGQTFTVDEQAVVDVAKFYKRNENKLRDKILNRSFIIQDDKLGKPNITPLEVRGAQLGADGKVKRGRPTKFPRHVVARLLGENDDPSIEAYKKISDALSVAPLNILPTTVAPKDPEISKEELTALTTKADAELEAKAQRILNALPQSNW